MRTNSTVSSQVQSTARDRKNERGAALLTALLISMLLLAAGGALIMTTALSATNAIDSTAETQAYYAAEAGMQASLNVLRGHVAPNPLFDTSSSTASANMINYTQAIATPTLSRWLTYSNTFGGSRVVITDTNSYSAFSGMAFTTNVTDPDSVSHVEFTVSGTFTNYGGTSHQFGGGSDKATLTYTAPSAYTGTSAINGTGTASLGSFAISQQNGLVTLTNEPFAITITQTAPYTQTLVIPCTLSGDITAAANTLAITFPTLSNNISGVTYTRTASLFSISLAGSTSMPVTVTAPEPSRVVVKVTGYGPRGSMKQMQMMVSRYAFDFKPNAAVTIRSAADTSGSSIQIGNSSQYTYTGNDQSGGTNLPAFVVTNGTDLTNTTGIIPAGTQVTGSQQVVQESLGNLSAFLQTAQGCRDLLAMMRLAAYNSDSTLNRYFTTTPANLGATEPNGLLTFVDGDCVLPPGGGAGLLIVTGILDMRGNADFKGLILVLGAGQVLRDGGGNGTTLGSIVVAKFDSTGDFLAPTFNSNGGGTSDIKYDSKWIETALKSAGPRVIAVSEY